MGQWVEFGSWYMPKMTSTVLNQGPSLLISLCAFCTHSITTSNAVLPNEMMPRIIITVYTSRWRNVVCESLQVVFVQNIFLK